MRKNRSMRLSVILRETLPSEPSPSEILESFQDVWANAEPKVRDTWLNATDPLVDHVRQTQQLGEKSLLELIGKLGIFLTAHPEIHGRPVDEPEHP
jgi:hypothetical protein